jgi:hypothetical protein
MGNNLVTKIFYKIDLIEVVESRVLRSRSGVKSETCGCDCRSPSPVECWSSGTTFCTIIAEGRSQSRVIGLQRYRAWRGLLVALKHMVVITAGCGHPGDDLIPEPLSEDDPPLAPSRP